MKFRMIPMIMFCVANSDFRERRVVSDPAPAIKGNASGITDAVS